MSTLKTRHCSKKTIALESIVYNINQYFVALFIIYVIYSFSIVKRKIQHRFPKSIADYLNFSFIVVKYNQNLNLGFN